MNMLLAKTAAAPTAKNSFIFTVLGAKWGVLWLWLLIINVLALVVYGVDKVLAKIKEHAPKTRHPGKDAAASGGPGRRRRGLAGHGAVPPQDPAPLLPDLRPAVHPDLDRCHWRALPLFQRHQINPRLSPRSIPAFWQYPVPRLSRTCTQSEKEDLA